MATIANLLVKIGADTQQLQKGLQSGMVGLNAFGKTSTSATNAGVTGMQNMNSATTITAVAIIGAAAAVGIFAYKCIKLASDLNEVQNVVDVTFRESAPLINNFAKTAVNSFGLSELAAKQYTGVLGAMLKSSGLIPSIATDMSIAMTGLAGDLASFYNLPIDVAFEKIKAGMAGEMEPLRSLGITLSVANLQAFAFSKGIKTSYEKMSEANKIQLRYAYLMKSTSDAQGDFVRTGSGWANQSRVLGLQWSVFMTEIGKSLLPALLPLLQVFNRLVGFMTSLAQGFNQLNAPARMFMMIGISLLGIIPLIVVALYALSAAKAWYATITAGATSALSGFSLGLIRVLGIVGIVLIALGALFAYFVKFKSATQPIVDTSAALLATKKATEGAAAGAQSLAGGLDDVSGAAKKLLSLAGFDQINKLGDTTAAGSLVNVGVDQKQLAQSLADLSSLQKGLDDLSVPPLEPVTLDLIDWPATWQAMKDFFNPKFQDWSKTKKDLQEQATRFGNDVKTAWNGFWNGAGSAWQKVKDWFNPGFQSWGTTKKQLEEQARSFGNEIKTSWNNFWASAGSAWQAVLDFFNPGFQDWSTISAQLQEQARRFGNDVKTAWNNFWAGAGSLWQTVKVSWIFSGIGNIVTSIRSYINDMIYGINKLISGINAITIDMPWWLGGASWHPSIPWVDYVYGYEAGGVFNKDTTIRVGEHGKEAVMPLENNTGWIDELAGKLAGMMGGQQLAGAGNVQVYIGNEQLDSYIVRTNDRVSTRSNGRS